MTPKSDHEEDMSMEEILASIRKFVTDNPPEDPNKQKVYKGDLAESVVIPPTGHTIDRDNREDHTQAATSKQTAAMSPPVFEPNLEDPSSAQILYRQHQSQSQHQPSAPEYESDILELISPIPQSSPISQSGPPQDYNTAWTPPSRTPFQKKSLEESIMTLTNPVDAKKVEKPNRPPMKASYLADLEDSLGSTQTMAASASSLSRLAQASKSVPKRPPSLADHRGVTLDQLIQDMIRPMIKQWIDTHLPSLVEEMVAKEIKRITKHLG